jgi:hypothetical protein
MGSNDFLFGLGEEREGVCCQDGLRCIFIEPELGICDDPLEYVCEDLANCTALDALLGPMPGIIEIVSEGPAAATPAAAPV